MNTQHTNKFLTPILLVLSIIVVICGYFDILGYHLLSAIFLPILPIIILFEGWSVSGEDNPQSFVYLSDHNKFEFLLRSILTLISLYIVFFINGKLSLPYCGIVLILLLCSRLSLIGDNKYSLNNIWKRNKIQFFAIVICLIIYFVLLYL